MINRQGHKAGLSRTVGILSTFYNLLEIKALGNIGVRRVGIFRKKRQNSVKYRNFLKKIKKAETPAFIAMRAWEWLFLFLLRAAQGLDHAIIGLFAAAAFGQTIAADGGIPVAIFDFENSNRTLSNFHHRSFC